MVAANAEVVIRRYMALCADLQARVIYLEAALEANGQPATPEAVAPEGTAA